MFIEKSPAEVPSENERLKPSQKLERGAAYSIEERDVKKMTFEEIEKEIKELKELLKPELSKEEREAIEKRLQELKEEFQEKMISSVKREDNAAIDANPEGYLMHGRNVGDPDLSLDPDSLLKLRRKANEEGDKE